MKLPSPTRIYRWLFCEEQWNVGIINEPINIFLNRAARPEISWLPPLGTKQYLADPFGIAKEQKLYVFCEKFDYRIRRGRIVCLEIRDGRIFAVTSSIELAIHASYPYLLEEQGELYCIPETYQAGEISLFKAEDFPHKWKKAATLVGNFAGLDSTVFRYNGRWWLTSAEESNHRYALFIWSSGDLFGPWIPHSANPVKRDISSSRPAGTPFIYGGHLYRPAQDCSNTYGGRIVLNRILRLTPTEFQEERAAVIDPDPNGPYPNGLHTISSCGNMTLVDGKCYKFKTINVFKRRSWREASN